MNTSSPRDLDLELEWLKLRASLKKRFGKAPDLDAILFLIGMQEFGQLNYSWTKEQKQELMHVAVCTVLAPEGFFKYLGRDDDEWPHFEQIKTLPKFSGQEQEQWLKLHIIRYFQQHLKE